MCTFPNVRVDFFMADRSVQLKGIFKVTGLRRMLEGNHQCSLDMLLLFIFAFVGRVTEYVKVCLRMHVHTLYSDLL